MGDASDNVPGVAGIGEKGAVKLLQEWKSLDALLANIDSLKGKAGEHIRRDRAQLELSRELVTIARDVPLDPGFAGLKPPAPDAKALTELYRRLDFKSLVPKVVAGPKAVEERDYVLVRDGAMLDAMIAELTAAGRFAFDTETTSLSPLQATLVGCSFSAQPMRAFYVPMNAEPPVLPGGPAAILETLRPLLDRPGARCASARTRSTTGS